MRKLRSPRTSLTVIVAMVVPVAACASAGPDTTMRTPDVPVSTTIETSTGTHTVDIRNSASSRGADIAVPLERAWLALPGVYDGIGLTEGGSTDLQGHTYGVLNKRVIKIAGKRLDEYLDCGDSIEGPRANIYEVRVSALTSLMEKDGGTHVETIVQATAKPRGTSGNAVTCRSRATLEALIVQQLAAHAG